MIEIRAHPEFARWLITIKDPLIRGILASRLRRLERGLFGDARPVGAGVSELRIHVGPGWRVYFLRCDAHLILLLGGGTKRTQTMDIIHAVELARRLV